MTKPTDAELTNEALTASANYYIGMAQEIEARTPNAPQAKEYRDRARDFRELRDRLSKPADSGKTETLQGSELSSSKLTPQGS